MNTYCVLVFTIPAWPGPNSTISPSMSSVFWSTTSTQTVLLSIITGIFLTSLPFSMNTCSMLYWMLGS